MLAVTAMQEYGPIYPSVCSHLGVEVARTMPVFTRQTEVLHKKTVLAPFSEATKLVLPGWAAEIRVEVAAEQVVLPLVTPVYDGPTPTPPNLAS